MRGQKENNPMHRARPFYAEEWRKCQKFSITRKAAIKAQFSVTFSSCQRNLIKNISDRRHDCTDYKYDLDFFLRLVKWPKIAVKKSQIF